jgi:hypothetical protein
MGLDDPGGILRQRDRTVVVEIRFPDLPMFTITGSGGKVIWSGTGTLTGGSESG